MKRATALSVAFFLMAVTFVDPVFAQDATTQTDGTDLGGEEFTLPGLEEGQAALENQEEEQKAAEATAQQNFLVGGAAGAAVGIVVGGALVWFLKPERE